MAAHIQWPTMQHHPHKKKESIMAYKKEKMVEVIRPDGSTTWIPPFRVPGYVKYHGFTLPEKKAGSRSTKAGKDTTDVKK